MRAFTEGTIPRATWDKLGVVSDDTDAIERHLRGVLALPFLDVPKLKARRFRVVMDTCHGAGNPIMVSLLERLGCDVTLINGAPDGKFHRSPEPIAENLGELEAAVVAAKADVGFATDPDVDRLAIVSEQGRAIGEDYTLALATQLVLAHRAGAVVTNLSSSRVIDDAAALTGTSVMRAPVGEVNVAVAMRDAKAVVGGEGNGGVILPELHLGRDAPVAAALVLQLLLETGKSVSEIIASRPRYAIVKDKLPRPNAPLDAVYAALTDAFPDAGVDRQDGLRLAWPDRWVHVRPSGTEPIVRVIAEAPTDADARALVARSRVPLDALAGTATAGVSH
jgi:phosphomannomutase